MFDDAPRPVKHPFDKAPLQQAEISLSTKTLAPRAKQRIVILMEHETAPPSMADLKDAALRYVARYAATQASVRRVLVRRIDAWQRRSSASSEEIRSALVLSIEQIIADLTRSGAIDDKTYAETRGRSLRREGQSGRSARAKLIAKGVPAHLAEAAITDDPTMELAAILIAARRRRLGPFASPKAIRSHDPVKALARLVRAGFAPDLARRALYMTAEEAEAVLFEARRSSDLY
jgi:regulatory protein